MGLFDNLKDFAGSAKNAWDEEKKKLAEKEKAGQQAGTLKPNAKVAATPAPKPATSPKQAPAVIDMPRGIVNLKWGTINPIRYHDYANGVEIPVKMCGLVEVRVATPDTTIGEDQFKTALLDLLQPIIAGLENDFVPYDKLQFQQQKLADELNASFAKDNILITRFLIASVSPREEEKKPLDMSQPDIAAKVSRARGDAPSGKFCPQCGAPDTGAKFCSNCGAVLNQ